MPVTTSGTDARFSTLLEPIRDLAENWSIDIASELEEYLGELEAITISFEDGRTLNFVEAAMVIQGSACIYGKKVEHLHTLVYNTLHQIVEKKKAKEAAAAAGADGEGAEGQGAGAEDGEDEDFEPLEGALAPKEVDNINLAQGGGVLKDGEGLITRLPPFLMMMQDDHMKEQLKMHACVQHASGALLLPYTDVPPAWLDAFGPGDECARAPQIEPCTAQPSGRPLRCRREP